MFDNLRALELPLIHLIQQARGPILDQWFIFLNYFDTQEFMFILIPAVWMGIGWKKGANLLSIVLLSVFINFFLKHLFLEPRPYVFDPSFAVIKVTGYSFPSGAAQMAILLPGILLSYKKNVWTWLIAVNYCFWISVSRLYLGVHFPTDLIGGWMIGGVLLYLYIKIFPKIERVLKKRSIALSYALSFIVPLAFLTGFTSLATLKITLVALGAGIGSCLSLSFGLNPSLTTHRIEIILRVLIGILGLFLLYMLMSLLLSNQNIPEVSLKHVCIGLWFGVGANLVWRALFSSYFSKQTRGY